MNERLIWDAEQEKLSWEAYACLKDLGLKMSYDDFLRWLKLKLGEQNASTEK